LSATLLMIQALNGLQFGLILFLIAGLVTSRFGDELGLVIPEGESRTVQNIGTTDLMLVKNNDFEAPGFETGMPTDFTTDLAVYQNGAEVARKTIRVNDPLGVGGYTFHQNGFGPAPILDVRDTSDGSVLWSGPVALTDAAGGMPFGALPVPGRSLGLQLLLSRDASGVGTLVVVPYRITGTNPDGTPQAAFGFPAALQRGETGRLEGLDLSVSLRAFSDYTLLIAKRDPGQPIIWGAFATLIVGLAITFYLPRRRIWARVAPGGKAAFVARSDRYVDLDREFGRFLDDLVARRRGPARATRPGSGSRGSPRSPWPSCSSRASRPRGRAGALDPTRRPRLGRRARRSSASTGAARHSSTGPRTSCSPCRPTTSATTRSCGSPGKRR